MPLIATAEPGVLLARSRSRPGQFHIVMGAGTPFAVCDCEAAQAGRDCAHRTEAMEVPVTTTDTTRAVELAQNNAQVVRAAAATLQAAQHLQAWESVVALGAGMRASGLLPNTIDNDQKAGIVLLKALSLGIEPAQAFSYIDVIKGSPFVRAEMVRALVARSGLGRIEVVESSSDRAVVRGVRQGWAPCVVTYTIEDAKRAGLTNNPNYSNHPADMLVARASVRVGRRLFADVLAGMDVAQGGDVADTLDAPDDGGTVVIEGVATVVQDLPSGPQRTAPEWRDELDAARQKLGLSWLDIGAVIGKAPSIAAIQEWLDADPERTPAKLLSLAADRKAAQ